jgi:hypothetical protein
LRNLTAVALGKEALMVKKPTAIPTSGRSAFKGARNDGDGNAIHNRVLLGMAAKECEVMLAKLVFVNFNCNRLHGVEARLPRWLLMSQDRMRNDILPLTQEFLSQMLGIRRASVSVAARILQRAGLIQYTRGHVSILNRAELENASCECYMVIQQQLENWRKESSNSR